MLSALSTIVDKYGAHAVYLKCLEVWARTLSVYTSSHALGFSEGSETSQSRAHPHQNIVGNKTRVFYKRLGEAIVAFRHRPLVGNGGHSLDEGTRPTASWISAPGPIHL